MSAHQTNPTEFSPIFKAATATVEAWLITGEGYAGPATIGYDKLTCGEPGLYLEMDGEHVQFAAHAAPEVIEQLRRASQVEVRLVCRPVSGAERALPESAIAATSTRPGEVAPQQAVPAVGASGFDYKTAADFLGGKAIGDEEVRRFVASARAAHDDRESLRAQLHSLRGELSAREAEIALLKQSLLDCEAAQMKAAPAGWRLVPTEITREMAEAWQAAFNRQLKKRMNSKGRLKSAAPFKKSCEEVAYAAMLDAAPQQAAATDHTEAHLRVLIDLLNRRPALNAELATAYSHWTSEVYDAMGAMHQPSANHGDAA